ncbi:MAG TPA: hypothetical protein VFJ72_15025 [Rubrobacteraceae bacterium]|nr:hypothetical protein [Rubrobacteraceae bacterium]
MERGREEPKSGSEYTVIGVISDGAELNQAVTEVRELGVGRDDLTVILKRQDPSEPEPFPEGTRYIVIPNDRRGLEVPIGFAIAFVVFGIFFALSTPAIGIPTLMVFVSLASILVAGSLTRVGVSPILTEMEAPREEAGTWNDEFEMGKVLIFATTRERRLIRPIREAMQRGGAMYYIVNRRLEPRAVHQAILKRAGSYADSITGGPKSRVGETRDTASEGTR